MAEEASGTTKFVVAVSIGSVLGLMSWVGISLNNMQTQQARFDEKLDFIAEKTREIVPRSENERRYSSLEKTTEQNADRISRMEQNFMTLRQGR